MNSFINTLKAKDISILKIINNSIKCKLLDIIMIPFTYLGSAAACLSFTIFTLFYPNDRINIVGYRGFFSLLFSGLIVRFIKNAVNRIRPFLKVQNLYTKKIGIDEYSFPSGHTTAAFTMAVSIALTFANLTVLCIIIASFVGVSRIYLGVHYPSDVAVGTIIGIITPLIVNNFI